MNNRLPDNNVETRQERRERRLKKKRERMPQHGKNLAKTYMDAILKKLRGRRRTKRDVDKGNEEEYDHSPS